MWVLQVDWFVPTTPRLLPLWLIALGLEAMFLGATWQAVQEVSGFEQATEVEQMVTVGGLGLGYLFLTLSVFRTSYASYAAYLYLLFRGVEGVAATHLYFKLYEFLRGNGLNGSFAARARYLLAVFFVTALGGYLILKALVGRPQVAGIWYDISVVYTAMVAVLAFLAVRWRYRNVATELNDGIVGGLALCIAGAQIFGFSLAGDILLTVAGSLVYSVGFWVSAYLIWGGVLLGDSSTDDTCQHCQGQIPAGSNAQYCPHCGTPI